MAFPRLVLAGTPSKYFINSITLEFPNSNSVIEPNNLIRAKYDVKRDFKLGNISGGTAKKYPDIIYDSCRFVHSWVGYVDVATDSIAESGSSDIHAQNNLELIKTAFFFLDTRGITYNVPYSKDQSVNEPRSPTKFEEGTESVNGDGWAYSKNEAGTALKKIPYWIIKDISITDNQNLTSRVTFMFEYITPWIDMRPTFDSYQ